MRTLSTENREDLANRARAIFRDIDFSGCITQVSALAHANFSDCVEALSEKQRRDLKEAVDHIDYSLGMHERLLNESLSGVNNEELIGQKRNAAKEAMEIEVMAVFKVWPVF
ncbi:MAG: hypothetical protein K2J10_07715 [Muribaculaceae bacterium]|nr:hypothetical protein [Muribaculaceae bacterium]